MFANQFRYLLLAIHRYTRFPISGRALRWASPPGLDTGRAIRFLPLAGLISGLYGAVIYLLFAQLLPHAVATLLAITFGLLITGGRQEAALARFFDARTPRAIAVPGVLMLLLVVLLRAETLSSLDPSWLSLALLTGQPLSYGIAALAAIGARRRLGDDSFGARVVDRSIAAGIAVLPLALAVWWFDAAKPFAFAVVPALVFGGWLRLWLGRRLRALATGRAPAEYRAQALQDGTGAIQQVSELAYHLGLLVWWSLIGMEAGGDDAGADSDADIEDGDEEPPDTLD
ncbi:MAG: adenosylcobinamide-GDP ribazoletransferase [Burkholderiaceae bacterium]